MDAREHVESPARTHACKMDSDQANKEDRRISAGRQDFRRFRKSSFSLTHPRAWPWAQMSRGSGSRKSAPSEVPVGWESVQETYEAKRRSTQQIPLE